MGLSWTLNKHLCNSLALPLGMLYAVFIYRMYIVLLSEGCFMCSKMYLLHEHAVSDWQICLQWSCRKSHFSSVRTWMLFIPFTFFTVIFYSGRKASHYDDVNVDCALQVMFVCMYTYTIDAYVYIHTYHYQVVFGCDSIFFYFHFIYLFFLAYFTVGGEILLSGFVVQC